MGSLGNNQQLENNRLLLFTNHQISHLSISFIPILATNKTELNTYVRRTKTAARNTAVEHRQHTARQDQRQSIPGLRTRIYIL